jgi:hypothetical protein
MCVLLAQVQPTTSCPPRQAHRCLRRSKRSRNATAGTSQPHIGPLAGGPPGQLVPGRPLDGQPGKLEQLDLPGCNDKHHCYAISGGSSRPAVAYTGHSQLCMHVFRMAPQDD